MDLSDIVEQAYVGLVGNRLNLLAKVGLLISAYTFDSSAGQQWWEALMYASAGLMGATVFGCSTLEHYVSARDQIRHYGRLDDRYARTLMEKNKGCFSGYCQIQGLYLAAKKYSQLEVFMRAKKAYSKNVIPNV